MADSDDDAPPPLSSLAEQVDALKLRSHGGESILDQSSLPQEEALRVANVVVKAAKPVPAAPALRKGFFDAAPKKKAKAPAEASTQKKTQPPVEEIPMIRAKKGVGNGPVIPDFLRVEPDEQEKRYMAMKADLVEKLKPTPDVMTKIGQDPGLLAAFDDPEIMAAVSDIAANPQNIKKYKDKPKVAAFYAAMGKLMGEKLDSMGQAAAGPGKIEK
ncbi:hypothetical protein VOLCADRAFT_96874 [Volvox carteri f. nagariensis]|uniref:STI1/HOP DP domain-containing protein n=1 Tax=Volvox carteri f. nagariensis TaxID=3068 RepID=D8UBI8_VOLCA|nr:uncharacterized protein VOLCADRAFT_96874 [Volvox carteri f. nagariensis]EFJ42953.1 hypothetical protein VOLCADRAFT_96874 [Volvox carteri f. nagariensis]|eukprot:XP_002955993.1 hypothetical protein VOLCADRAFT_96874 [Volvox carteri f. nagariensis]